MNEVIKKDNRKKEYGVALILLLFIVGAVALMSMSSNQGEKLLMYNCYLFNISGHDSNVNGTVLVNFTDKNIENIIAHNNTEDAKIFVAGTPFVFRHVENKTTNFTVSFTQVNNGMAVLVAYNRAYFDTVNLKDFATVKCPAIVNDTSVGRLFKTGFQLNEWVEINGENNQTPTV